MVVPEVGLEPTRLAAGDFESPASTIPPLGPRSAGFNRPPAPRQSEGSEVGCRKRVAIGDLAGLQPDGEPALALLGRAVGEGVRHRALARVALEGIVADLAGGVQRLFEVSGFDGAEVLRGVSRPDAGEAIGLKLHPDRDLVAVAAR